MNTIDDRIREFVENNVKPEKMGEALFILKTLKADIIEQVMNKVNKCNDSLNQDINTHGVN